MDTPYILLQVWIGPNLITSKPFRSACPPEQSALNLKVRQLTNIKDGIEQLMEPLLLGIHVLQSLVGCGV